eukprot:3066100-Prymnesium_polylepis.1
MGRSAPWSALGFRSRISGVGVSGVQESSVGRRGEGMRRALRATRRQQERSLNPRALRASTDGARLLFGKQPRMWSSELNLA